MLYEISHSLKCSCFVAPFTQGPWKQQTHSEKVKWWWKGLGEGEHELLKSLHLLPISAHPKSGKYVNYFMYYTMMKIGRNPQWSFLMGGVLFPSTDVLRPRHYLL